MIWLNDAMHGNTVRTECGVKTRYLQHITAELEQFRRILRRYGQHPAGAHLEVASTEVTECVGGHVTGVDALTTSYTTLCDPRLSPEQAGELLDTWWNQ